MRPVLSAAAILLLAGGLSAQEGASYPQMVLETTEGAIVIELYPDEAPASVANVIQYVEEGFYDGTIFHRVIPNFMVQGGGYEKGLVRKATRDPIQNEADNGLKNSRGTVALARTADPHSATAQFYINTVSNGSLNHRKKTDTGWGYCVFGKVIEGGMSVVDRISRTRTQTVNGRPDVPATPIVIERAYMRPQSEPTTAPE